MGEFLERSQGTLERSQDTAPGSSTFLHVFAILSRRQQSLVMVGLCQWSPSPPAEGPFRQSRRPGRTGAARREQERRAQARVLQRMVSAAQCNVSNRGLPRGPAATALQAVLRPLRDVRAQPPTAYGASAQDGKRGPRRPRGQGGAQGELKMASARSAKGHHEELVRNTSWRTLCWRQMSSARNAKGHKFCKEL